MNCNRVSASPIPVTFADVQRLLGAIRSDLITKVEIIGGNMFLKDAHQCCPFYFKGECTIWQARPKHCRRIGEETVLG